ncbi:CRISPR-associated endonuclease Cas1 [Thiolapillus sp.]|uniref:CRISPR-associated endonuclease Cas1 n=1 Tax=Thiolapillus sp. TaxID=2017437 RepID=UPI003AF80465
MRPGRHALALDLLEEFRAVFGDRLALTLINRGRLRQRTSTTILGAVSCSMTREGKSC